MILFLLLLHIATWVCLYGNENDIKTLNTNLQQNVYLYIHTYGHIIILLKINLYTCLSTKGAKQEN